VVRASCVWKAGKALLLVLSMTKVSTFFVDGTLHHRLGRLYHYEQVYLAKPQNCWTTKYPSTTPSPGHGCYWRVCPDSYESQILHPLPLS